MPGSTLPVPVTVDWTTPFAAVIVSLDVRAELVGGPICRIANTTAAANTTSSPTMCHEIRIFMQPPSSLRNDHRATNVRDGPKSRW
jgi:hypothetical protein